jgi:hypothetical protein
LMRAKRTFKRPKVVTQRTWHNKSERHFGLAIRAGHLLQLGHRAPFNNRAGAQHSQSSIDTRRGAMMTRFRARKLHGCMSQIAHLKTIMTILPNQLKVELFKYDILNNRNCEGARAIFSEPSNIELQIVRQKRIVGLLVECLASKYR